MRSSATLSLCLTLCGVARADIVPVPGTQSVGKLFRDSDVVCNCIVQSIAVTREETVQVGRGKLVRKHRTALVRVQQFYKGNPAEGSLLSVDFETEAPATRSLPVLSDSETAILFLKRSKSGYTFADPSLGATRFDRIPISDGGECVMKLQSALASVVRLGGRPNQLRAMVLLQGMDQFSPETVDAMNEVSVSSDPDLAFSALAVLLRNDPADGASRLSTYLAGYAGNDQHIALQALSSELMQIRDQRALTALGSLSASKFIALRFGAVEALRQMKSSQSAAALVRRLDDPDRDIQFMAVLALAEIYHKSGEFHPATPLFDSDPQHYTDLWKTWLQDSGSNAAAPNSEPR